MSEVAAAMGLAQLQNLEDIVGTNRNNYQCYQKGLAGIPGVTLCAYNERERCNYQYVVLEIDEDRAMIGRDLLVDVLWAENILARRYFHPGCHKMEPYRTQMPDAGERLPHTEALSRRVMVLPTGTSLGREEIGVICGIIRLTVANGREIRQRLGRV
jgi:dTDP-4-amino-4,6-dideoxygalactose transaminase